MANNRFYLRCKCFEDEGVMIGKDMGSGWYYGGTGDKVQEISTYIDKHDNCYFKLGVNHYLISYEDTDPTNQVSIHIKKGD